MTPKKTKVEKQTALAVSPQTAIENAEKLFTQLAEAFSAKLTTSHLAEAFSALKSFEKLIEKVEKVGRAQVLELLKTSGRQTTDAGTRVLETDGWHLEMRPYRSGTDPKKLEKLLRAKEIDPAKYMDAELVFKLSESKLKLALDKKALTADELETCRYEESWTVQTPKRVGED